MCYLVIVFGYVVFVFGYVVFVFVIKDTDYIGIFIVFVRSVLSLLLKIPITSVSLLFL
jgi:hypothetical protein